MADTKTKIIKLKVELDDRGLVKYVGEVKEAGRATDDLGKRGGIKQLNQDLGALAAKAGIAFGVLGGAAKLADEFSQIGQSALRNRAALESLTETTAEYEAKVKAVQNATRGLTTESEAAAIAARLQQFGLADTSAEMQAFVDTIVRVGAVNPMLGDTTEAINQIQLTLSNMSFMRLDQLGMSAGAVRARMKELKASTKDMTDEAAFQQAVMEGLAEQAARVDDEMLDIGSNQAKIKSNLRELRDTVSIGLNNILEDASGTALQIGAIVDEIGVTGLAVELAKEVGSSEISPVGSLHQDRYESRIIPGIGAVLVDTTIAAPDVPVDVGPMDVNNPGPQLLEMMRFQLAQFGPGQAPVDVFDRLSIGTGLRGEDLPNAARQIILDAAMDEIRVMQEAARVPALTNQNLLQGRGVGAFDSSIIPALDTSTFRARQSELGGGDTSLMPVQLPSLGMFHDMGNTAAQAVGTVQNEFDRLTELGESKLPMIVDGVGALRDTLFGAADAASSFFDEAERAQSLNELFGVAPDSLDADIYQRAAEAMRDAGLEGDAYAEAIRMLGLETGVTNAANEVYNAQLGNITTALADGTITTAEYLEQLRALATMDLTGVQQFADAMDPEQASEFINALSAESGMETFDTAKENIQAIMDAISGGGEGEEDDLGPFAGAADQVSNLEGVLLDANKNMTDDAIATWGTISGEVVSATDEMTAATNEFVEQAKRKFADLNMKIDVTARIGGITGDTPTTTGGGNSLTPEFAEGGYTGDMPGAFPAILHGREYVLSEKMLDNMKRGGSAMSVPVPAMPAMMSGGEQTQPVEIPLIVDGMVLARVIKDVNFRQNAGGAVGSN